MAKVKTYPWDPADHIEDGEDVLIYLEVITPEEYDRHVTLFILDCIARSKGVAEIAGVAFNETGDGRRSVTLTTTSGAEATVAIAPEVDLDRIRQTFSPRPVSESVSR